MAAGQTARKKLVRFLDQEAFDPILRARPDRYSAADKAKLDHVKGAPARTRQRYHGDYASAEEVRDRVRDDLSSGAAQQVQRQLDELGLPTMHHVRDAFEHAAVVTHQKLCRDLGVGR